MQQPTCTNTRIRSTDDAHKIFYAVQHGTLRMITRRLDADERLALTSGCVYAWEERGPHTEITGLGIERFTEGRRWSPSRVRDMFLFYYERSVPDTQAGSSEKQHPPRDWDPLVKQTYSVWVETEKGRRKWHLTAYFTQATVDQLGTVDDIPGVGNLIVPEDHFKSTRIKKGANKTDESASQAAETGHSSSSSRTFAPFPAPVSPTQNTSPVQTIHMFQPYANATQSNSYQPTLRTSEPSTPSVHYSVTPALRQSQLSSPVSGQYHSAESAMPSSTSIPGPSTLPARWTPPTNRESRTITSSNDQSLRLTIPPPASYSASSHPTVTSPVYHTPSGQPSPHTSHHPSWFHYPKSQQESFEAHENPKTYQPGSADAQSNTYSQQHSSRGYSYHAPSPVRPISSQLEADAVPSTSTPIVASNATYPTPAQRAVFPPMQPLPINALTSRYSPRHSAGFAHPLQATPAYPEVDCVSPVSSASGSGSSSVYGTHIGGSTHDFHYSDPIPQPSLENPPERGGEIGPQRDLAPLTYLQRPHPYRRHPGDDKTLRLLARQGSELEL
ncbi:hypothetical protein Moror_16479 [Moniliophthora roreri MCA 2997]|uniref:cAMP-independent regulatory protein pac2 n=2 Tax=Moniliophthora roreri TaxID=221103 RepID=V2WVK5_MONRO|nr:hypothetical protein Moror_16479 [Moniliophthora roreri MCA 2997]